MSCFGRFVLLSGLLLATSFARPVFADIIFSDNFNSYPNGTPPAPNWNDNSGSASTQVIENGRWFAGDGAGGIDYARTFGNITSGSVFAGFDLQVLASDLPSSSGGVFISHFAQSATSGFVSRLFIANSPTPNSFRLGITRGGTGESVSFWSSTLTANTVYRVVQGFNLATNEASLSVDGLAAVVNSTGSLDPTGISLFQFRVDDTTDGDKYYDNLIVATTFGEALSATAVPEPSSMVLLIVAASSVGVWKVKRGPFRRKANR